MKGVTFLGKWSFAIRCFPVLTVDFMKSADSNQICIHGFQLGNLRTPIYCEFHETCIHEV